MNKKYHLSSEQEQFIKDNWKALTREQLAVKMGLPVSWMSVYCVSKGYKKMHKVMKIKKEDKLFLPASTISIKRPPASYSNRSWEEVIGY